MPYLRIFTNVPKDKIPKDFVDTAIPVLSEAIGKPIERLICTIVGDTPVSFAGQSQEPAAVADIVSIGNLGPDENKKIIKVLSAHLEKELRVPPGRFLIMFNNYEAWNVGFRGSTVYDLRLD